MTHRNPYVGEGADGARRSAEIDRTEADGLDRTDPRYDELIASATRWDEQAQDLTATADAERIEDALEADKFAAMVSTEDPDATEAEAVLEHAERLYAAGRRDLPTATVIGRLDPMTDRKTWLELRRTGIGSSDMAAVLGMSKYRSELDVYRDKIGETPLDDDEAGEAARWGNLLEHIVAQEWAERHGVRVRRVGTVAHVDRRYLLCDLDRLVTGCPDHARCALEVKTRSAWKADEWRDGGTPEDVEAQVMQQLAVTGLEAIHVAALVGGQRLESRLVVPDADYIADLFTVADSFWNEHVLPQVPPAISSLELLEEYLKRLEPEKGIAAELDETAEHRVRHLTSIILAGKAAEAEADQAERELKALIGEDATDILLPDDTEDGRMVPWWTWRAQKASRRPNLDAIAAALDMSTDELKATYYESHGTVRVLRQGAGVKRLAAEQAGTDA